MDSSKILLEQQTALKEQSTIHRETSRKPEKNENQIDFMIPRQKKRAKAKKNFDDF